ncbi:serine carboxypeptidase-like 16 [Hevea brasiliensis]|uniref:serine carboxypeptidase-like 16 n=1 Tax=Hevea brasiliensis TaxID=3981 RepID=UPI0025E8CBC7|nr:serine carboxypeptidase-like 16 [Hevea brasiliensis]
MNARIQFAHRMTLLSDQLYKSTKEDCNGEYFFAPDPSNVACITNLQAVKNCLEKIYLPNVLEPKCSEFLSSKPIKLEWNTRDSHLEKTFLDVLISTA